MAVPEAQNQNDAERVPLGQLLVDAGLLDAADLQHVLDEQRRTGAPLGRMLVEGGYVASSTIAMALADQHGGLLKTEYGFATGRPTAAQRAARPEGDAPFDASMLPPVDEPPAEVSLPPLLLASQPVPEAARETRRPDLELAPPPAVAVPEVATPTAVEPQPVVLAEPEPVLVTEAVPVVVVDERDQLAGKLAAAELERDALRNRLDEALQARRAADAAAQASAEGTRETLSVLQRDAEAAVAALTIARDELAAAQARIAELELQPAEPADDGTQEALDALQAELAQARATIAELAAAHAEPVVDAAAQAALAALREELAASASALTEARNDLEAARIQITELEAVSFERVGADVAHDTLVALQQENDAATTALAAARGEVGAAKAELERLRAECGRAEALGHELEHELSARGARIDALEAHLAGQAAAAEPAEASERVYDEGNHVLLVPSESGYVTLERPGPPPQQGDTVVLAIGRYEVSRRGASPFPEDTRGCAYLIQA